jgi:acetoin utilization deacetylase AcuC-like enzyme
VRRGRDKSGLSAAFSPHYSFDLPPHHLFPMAKYRLVYERLRAEGLLPDEAVLTPSPATEEELRRVHAPDYVSRFLAGELTEGEERRLGFPWSPALCRRALHATGGTLLAARRALQDGIACNLAGGSHHAFADHGEGYCAFHDMAVAILALRAEGPARRIAIIDLDVHQGNGSAALFHDDPGVFTFSIHCQSNYPLRKVPGSRDIGLPDGVGDALYLFLLDRELDLLWREFRPEMVFYQAGVDPLAGDRLGRLRLSREGLRRRDHAVLHRCVATETPVVTVMGGGYGAVLEETVEAHADTVRAARALLQPEAWPP